MSDKPCQACGRPLPRQCDRCGKTVDRTYRLVHKPTNMPAEWCESCYGDWVNIREFREFEDSGVVRG